MIKIKKLFTYKPVKVYAAYVILDIFCIGLGMGIPIFNILFGFFVGWYLVRWISNTTSDVSKILKRLLIYSCYTVAVTFIGMILLWGWSAKLLNGSEAEIANFGIPMILYEPRISLIGWLVLMIAISPFLQLLTTVFAALLTLVLLNNKKV